MSEKRYKKCNSCGAENAIDESFCMECMGTDLSIVEDKSKVSIEKDKNIDIVPNQTLVRYKICNGCRARNTTNEAFCMECFGTDFTKLDNCNNEEIQDADNNLVCDKSSNQDKNMDGKTVIEPTYTTLKLISDEHEQIISPNDIIGRQAVWADLLGAYKTISRKHARFSFENNQWYIEDLGSANGSFLNGMKLKIEEKQKVNNGDILMFSSKFSMKVQRED